MSYGGSNPLQGFCLGVRLRNVREVDLDFKGLSRVNFLPFFHLGWIIWSSLIVQPIFLPRLLEFVLCAWCKRFHTVSSPSLLLLWERSVVLLLSERFGSELWLELLSLLWPGMRVWRKLFSQDSSHWICWNAKVRNTHFNSYFFRLVATILAGCQWSSVCSVYLVFEVCSLGQLQLASCTQSIVVVPSSIIRPRWVRVRGPIYSQLKRWFFTGLCRLISEPLTLW